MVVSGSTEVQNVVDDEQCAAARRVFDAVTTVRHQILAMCQEHSVPQASQRSAFLCQYSYWALRIFIRMRKPHCTVLVQLDSVFQALPGPIDDLSPTLGFELADYRVTTFTCQGTAMDQLPTSACELSKGENVWTAFWEPCSTKVRSRSAYLKCKLCWGDKGLQWFSIEP